MTRPTAPSLFLALLASVVVALSGCGEEDAELLPGAKAREITANLDATEQLADEGDCAGAESAALEVGEQVEALQGVDPRLKRALARGAERLQEVVAGCEEELEATEPLPTEPEVEEEATDELEKEEEREEKEEERREKEVEREEADEPESGEDGGPPSTAPPADGEGGDEEGEGGGPPPVEEGAPPSSGGVSPANPAGGG